MKKQFTKFKIAAENLSRSSKSDKDKDAELETIEKQVERYREVLEKMVRKLPTVSTPSDKQDREKRIRKNSHYKIGQALDESAKELAVELPLHHVLLNCGDLEKSIAECTVDSELETETEVVRKLKLMVDNEIVEIAAYKRNVTRTLQEYTSLKRSYEAALRLDEPQSKVEHIKEQQEQCELKLEKERDAWAAKMFELISKEDIIVSCVRDYVLNQRNYHERALSKVNASLAQIQDTIQSTVKSRFGTSLAVELSSTERTIAYIVELCACCLIENGLQEEGLLRVGCAKTKLSRMERALEAQYVKPPLPVEYQDPHVIGAILKLYLRELPEPLLTYRYHKDFLHASERATEGERKAGIKAILAKLPAANYANLRYLTKFLWLVTQNADYNRMSAHNLAIVMSPNMIWPRPDKNNSNDYMGQVNCSSAGNIIVDLLISQWAYFFDGDVEFFQTLQRGQLFALGKVKSNSSNEHLDRHDGDSLDSPRFGTIRRQKAYAAPSPPGKTTAVATSNANEKTPQNNNNNHSSNNNNNHNTSHAQQQLNNETTPAAQRNGELSQQRAKELFPAEKPEKPPLPKVPQFQVTTNAPAATTTATAQDATTPKPVPMTRTQFFGLDNLPSPVADRRSNDSVSSLTFKPDLPQKPKIPKRPMVLALGGNRSDEETTPTQTSNCDNFASLVTTAGIAVPAATTATGSALKEHSQKFLCAEQNANAVSSGNGCVATTTSSNAVATTTTTNSNTPHSNAGNGMQAPPPPPPTVTSPVVNHSACATTSNSTVAAAVVAAAVVAATTVDASTNTVTTVATRHTPTTPTTPNMIMTPKRPTVPAPPPPTMAKKAE